MRSAQSLVIAAVTLSLAATSAQAQVGSLLRETQKAADGVAVGSALGAKVADAETRPVLEQVGEMADTLGSALAVGETAAAGAAIAQGSGAVIMKTLAAAGGPVAAGGLTGLSAAHLMNKTLYSDCVDQEACDAAQVGTYVGAAAGTMATAGAVMAAGAGPAGLAAIGAGSMAVGAGMLLAAPVVGAAAVGALVYWLFSD